MIRSFNVTRPSLRQNFARLDRKRSRLKFFDVSIGATPLHRQAHYCASLSAWCRRGREASLPYTYPFERDGSAVALGGRGGDAPYCGQTLESFAFREVGFDPCECRLISHDELQCANNWLIRMSPIKK